MLQFSFQWSNCPSSLKLFLKDFALMEDTIWSPYCWLQAGNVLEKRIASCEHSITQMRRNLYLKRLHKTLTCHTYAASPFPIQGSETANYICLLVSLGSCNCSVFLEVLSLLREESYTLQAELGSSQVRQAWQFDQKQTEHFAYLGMTSHCP